MKIGDLVELSAAGNKIQFLSCYNGKHGIVVNHHKYMGWTVQWFGVTAYQWRRPASHRKYHNRRELKYLKKKGGK